MKKITKEKLKYLSDFLKTVSPKYTAADWTWNYQLQNNAAALIETAKYAHDVEEFYEIRYEKLKKLCEKNNLSTEFFNIMANGKENYSDIPHQCEIRNLKYELDKANKTIKKCNENIINLERELYRKLDESDNKCDSLTNEVHIYKDLIIDLISNGINEFHFKDVISFKKIDNIYEVEYESYYNPHANPKQLKDIKKFDNVPEMVIFMLNFLKERF